ncbi:phosphatidate cytidylyltransferase [Aestuariivirga sp.]|uniref:phosphatidate cytidylyltransferase n=1 Tax=Aestuariivirga sp. TaxID=2650926 RepID=UPI003593708C
MAETPPSVSAKWGDLGVRALSAAVLIPAVLADVWAGGIWFHLFVALIGILMAQEWVAIVHRGNPVQFALHSAGAMCGALLPLDVGLGGGLIAIALLSILSIALAAYEETGGPAWRYLGVPYVSIPLIALVLLREDPDYGIAAIVLIMLMVWAADTLAYFAGRIIGGPKLAPRISPKKTWAGLGGAMAGSALGALAVGLWLGLPALVVLVMIAAAMAIVEQAGDLFKSAMKRHYGVKDSGRLIPGHGGVIDRVDGLVAVATAAALIGVLKSGVEHSGAGILLW